MKILRDSELQGVAGMKRAGTAALRVLRLGACLLFFHAAGVVTAESAPARSPIVKIDAGSLQGVSERGIFSFKGIPYAAPPVGDLRWRSPQPVNHWSGVRQAVEYGNSCVQPNITRASPPPFPPVPQVGPTSEDCLYLNVWAPAGARTLPVMLSFHGGSMFIGSGRLDGDDGLTLARKGVVVVSINYRLGPFGFFAHPELTREAKGEPATNFGILDEIAALKWVRRNAAAFGGDPKNITIFGISAGGRSVDLLITSPLTRGLFQRAISGSGSYTTVPMLHLQKSNADGRESAEKWGTAWAAKMGAPGLKVLRAMPAETILAGSSGMFDNVGQIIDGQVLTMDIAESFRSGRQHKVPYINGTTDMEGSIGARQVLPAELEERLKTQPEVIRQVFDPDRRLSPAALRMKVMGHLSIVKPTQQLSSEMTRAGAPGYHYVFAYVPTSVRSLVEGAWHGADGPYIYGQLVEGRSAAHRAVTTQDLAMADAMQTYWTNFAKSGRPWAVHAPRWGLTSQGAMVFSNDGPIFVDDYMSKHLSVIGLGDSSVTPVPQGAGAAVSPTGNATRKPK